MKTTASSDVVEGTIQPSELAVEVAQLWPPRGQWTEADYFALPDTNRFIELSEGELVMPPHPTHTHQVIVLELATRMRAFVHEPDILFVAREHSDRIGEQAYGPPDVAVEVLSPGTRRTDRLEKTVEYARAGVREYWIVDPHGQTVEVFLLREGAYELLGKWGRGEDARSEVLAGFEMAVDEVLGSK